MTFARYLCSTAALSAILAVADIASAGCKCGGGGVPPAPSAWSGGYGGGAMYGTNYGGYGAYGGYGGGYSGYGNNGGYGWGDPAMQPYGGQVATNGPHWAPGGYESRVGSPAYYYDPSGGQYSVTGDPNYDHFGPGFHRSSIHGHYRYPYYNYRAPWYYPGRGVYNRNTNFAW